MSYHVSEIHSSYLVYVHASAYLCMLRPTTTCMRSPKRKRLSDKSDIDASPQLPISTGVPRLPWSVPLDRSRSPRSAIKSRVLMHAYVTRGLGFLLRCATISRQLGQGRLRSGGSPLFMINHMSSTIGCLDCKLPTTEGLEVWSFQLITRARDSRCVATVRTLHART